MVEKAWKFRCYPTPEQEKRYEENIGVCASGVQQSVSRSHRRVVREERAPQLQADILNVNWMEKIRGIRFPQ